MNSRALIGDVADTARWVAFHRALESERPKPLFYDPFARRLAGERGKKIVDEMPDLPGGGLTWALAVRTRVFDELILAAIDIVGADAVLNLAAGLDARPYRLSLPRRLVWIEADHPSILAAKTEVLSGEASSCAVERVAINLGDDAARRDLIGRVATSHARVVVVTEGLLVYLDEALVGSLADDLRAVPAMCRWILESASPALLKRQMRAWGNELSAGRAEMKFASAEGLDFFRRHGWSPVDRRSCVVEARRLGREMRYAPFVRALSRVSRRFRASLENAAVYGAVEPTKKDGVDRVELH